MRKKDREYNDLLEKHNLLMKEQTKLVKKLVDLKILFGDLKTTNKKQRAEFVEDLKPYRYVRLLGESGTMGDIIKKWEGLK